MATIPFQTDPGTPHAAPNGHPVHGTLVVDANGRPFDEAQVIPEGSVRQLANLRPIWDVNDQIEWLIEGLLPLRSMNLLSSESGTGKTWVAYAMAGAVAHGVPFLNCPVKQRPVLYIDGENPAAIAKRNVTELGIARSDHLDIWGGWSDSRPPGPDHRLVRRFAEQKKGLLIWDSLVEFHTGDEQSARETRAFMKKFRDLANVGATILILHHMGKGENTKQYRGSSDIKAAVDTAYTLKTEATKDGKLFHLKLENFKSRFAAGQDFGLEFHPQRGFVRRGVPAGQQAPTAEDLIRNILTLQPNINGKQIWEQVKNQGAKKRQIEECLKEGPWQRARGRGRAFIYSLPADEPAPELVDIAPGEEVAA